jgi:hypothetical protein
MTRGLDTPLEPGNEAGSDTRSTIRTAADVLRFVLRAVVAGVRFVRQRAPRPVRWLLAKPERLLTVAWLVGILIVGSARVASADIIVGPDLAQGAPKTLYETYDFSDYKLTVKPDAENSDWFDIGETVLEVVGFINNLMLWAILGVTYGGLALLEWFLNLTLYRDSAPEIDTATQMVANEVFWPLISATVAVGAFITYARWRGEGRGFLSDFGWVVAAGALAAGFASGPSTVMNTVDSVRQDLATGIMTGASRYIETRGNPTGFPTPEIGGDRQKAATRKIVDGMWNTYGATVWCFAQFHDLSICRVAGHHALANDEQWQQWMAVLDDGGAPPEFGQYVHWIRGQDMTRTGYLLLLAFLTIPIGLIHLRLIISGLIAVTGFLLMLVIGLVFLVFWPIPGWFRQLGTRYWVYTLGMQVQGLFITVVISGETVTSMIIITQVGTYGITVVAIFTGIVAVAATKANSWMELFTTVGGAGTLGYAAMLLAVPAARAAARATTTLATGVPKLAVAGFQSFRSGGPATRMPLPGFKPGTWRNPPAPPEQDPAPVWATATRESFTGVGRPRSPLRITGAPEQTEPVVEGTVMSTARRRPEFPYRRVRDWKLRRNVSIAQERTERRGRVWVDKRGVGISALDPISPRERMSGYRVTRYSDIPQSQRIQQLKDQHKARKKNQP